jgi:hypothetical protein
MSTRLKRTIKPTKPLPTQEKETVIVQEKEEPKEEIIKVNVAILSNLIVV